MFCINKCVIMCIYLSNPKCCSLNLPCSHQFYKKGIIISKLEGRKLLFSLSLLYWTFKSFKNQLNLISLHCLLQNYRLHQVALLHFITAPKNWFQIAVSSLLYWQFVLLQFSAKKCVLLTCEERSWWQENFHVVN